MFASRPSHHCAATVQVLHTCASAAATNSLGRACVEVHVACTPDRSQSASQLQMQGHAPAMEAKNFGTPHPSFTARYKGTVASGGTTGCSYRVSTGKPVPKVEDDVISASPLLLVYAVCLSQLQVFFGVCRHLPLPHHLLFFCTFLQRQ
ncbi:hypothetical protein GGI35DRAFT_11550 [Trichoderma velutinum]